MASIPTDSSPSTTHAFRVHANLHGLVPIEPTVWHQIIQHVLPLGPANAAVRLLVLTGRGTVCESIEALQLQTDSFGFLLTFHISAQQLLPDLKIANSAGADSAGKVIDSRRLFLRRYLSHRHGWQPSTALLAEALIRSGYGQVLEGGTPT